MPPLASAARPPFLLWRHEPSVVGRIVLARWLAACWLSASGRRRKSGVGSHSAGRRGAAVAVTAPCRRDRAVATVAVAGRAGPLMVACCPVDLSL